MMDQGQAKVTGVTIGMVLAAVISYTAHKSILWAIIHGFFSWLYVIYYVLTRGPQ